MVWCKKNKLIFIHIPKTGGTTIEEYLNLEKYYNGYGKIKEISLQHLSGINHKVLLKDDFNKFFKFTIVRDPIERMISEYYLNKIDGYINNNSFDKFLDIVEEKIKENNFEKKKILKDDNISKTILSVTKYVNQQIVNEFNFDTYLNEKKWLTILKDTDIIAKPIHFDDENKIIITEYAGEKLNKYNIPNDYKKQIDNILNVLKDNNCKHNDIKPDELLVLNGKIRIIDFGWAHELDQEIPACWPKLLGGKFKCNIQKDENGEIINSNKGFDDKCSIDKCLEHILNNPNHNYYSEQNLNYLSQTSFIYDKNNQIMVDKIFRFENYNEIEDFLIQNYKNENLNTIGKHNEDSIKKEDKIKLTVQQKARIYNLYKEDFINFDYHLDDETIDYIKKK